MSSVARYVYLVVAYLCIALGLAGAILPLLPATLSAKWLAMLASFATLIVTGAHWGVVLAMRFFFCAIGSLLWTRPNPRY